MLSTILLGVVATIALVLAGSAYQDNETAIGSALILIGVFLFVTVCASFFFLASGFTASRSELEDNWTYQVVWLGQPAGSGHQVILKAPDERIRLFELQDDSLCVGARYTVHNKKLLDRIVPAGVKCE